MHRRKSVSVLSVLGIIGIIIGALYLGRHKIEPLLPSSLISALHLKTQNPDQAASPASTSGTGAAASTAKQPAVSVTITTAKAGSLPIIRQTIGAVMPIDSTALSSQLAGIVSEIPIKDGSIVKQGDLLLRLDQRLIKADIERDQAAIARDQATLDDANASLKRIQDLVKTGVDTKQAGDDAIAAQKVAQGALAVDQAQLASDQVSLALTEITAPFDGQIGAVTPSIGAYIAPGATLVTITRMKPVYAQFYLPETDLDQARKSLASGQLKATISTGLSSQIIGGTPSSEAGPVIFIDNAIDPNSASFMLRAQFANEDGSLWPGRSLNVTLQTGALDNLVIVPNVAVRPKDDGNIAYVVMPDNHIEIRNVTVALRTIDEVGVTKGLSAGDRLVLEGQDGLTKGTLVRIVATPTGTDAAQSQADASGPHPIPDPAPAPAPTIPPLAPALAPSPGSAK